MIITKKKFKKALKYAASYQKARDYQDAGEHLVKNKPKINKVLNILYKVEDNVLTDGTLTIKEILKEI